MKRRGREGRKESGRLVRGYREGMQEAGRVGG